MWMKLSVSSCLFLKWFFLQKASGTRFRRHVITGFSLMRKDCTPRYSKTVIPESGCGSASWWNRTESSTIVFSVPCFHEENSGMGKRHLCHAPEIPLPHHIKSGSKNCRTWLWDKQTIDIHLLVLPFFTRFWSAKPGKCFRCIVQVLQCFQIGTY